MPQLSEACAVLTAAGSGSRLGCELPKALVSLSGRPLVWWAARGLRAGGVGMIVVTAPASSIEACPPFFQRRKNIASSAPDRLCHTENTAAGSAVSGVAAK